jgi:hypothetical protein
MSRDPFSYDPQEAREPAPADALRRQTPVPFRPRREEDLEAATPGSRQRPADREPAKTRDVQRDSVRAYYVRERAYLLRDSELHSMKEIGKFRVVAAQDLARFAYGGDCARMEADMRRLKNESLVSEKSLEISRKQTLRVVVLTKAGRRLLQRTNQLPEDQAIYHGLVKFREAGHDTDLYRLYQKEVARIERAGGHPVRVILDYEIKRNLNRDLALLGEDKDDLVRKAQVARKHGLAVVGGKILVPDMRLEYEDADLAWRRVDLELTTREYRPRALAAKARAGFAIYSRAEDAPRVRRILHEAELTREILML